MKSKTIRIPLYFEKLKIVVVDKLDKPEYDAYVLFEKDKLVLFVKPDTTAGVIAHEAVHIANYVFKQCGILPDLNNDEPQAYLIGWIVKQIHKFIQSCNEEIRNTNN